jgi:hypothetical protein
MMLTLDAAIAAAPRCRLDDMARAVWSALAGGQITEHDAERLSMAVEARRAESAIRQPKRKTPASEPLKPVQRQAAIERRRRQAASGALPPSIAAHFTLGEQAALAVIARAARQQRGGTLQWFTDKIAALAGVSRSTARNAIRKARALGFLHVTEQRVTWWRNAANLITVAAAAWRSWLGWGQKPDRHDYKQEQKEAWRGKQGQTARPFPADQGHVNRLRC